MYLCVRERSTFEFEIRLRHTRETGVWLCKKMDKMKGNLLKRDNLSDHNAPRLQLPETPAEADKRAERNNLIFANSPDMAYLAD